MVQGTVLVDYKWVTTNFKRAPDCIPSRLCTYTRHYSASVSIGSLRHFQSGSHLVPQCNLHSIARLLAATPTTDACKHRASAWIDWCVMSKQRSNGQSCKQFRSFARRRRRRCGGGGAAAEYNLRKECYVDVMSVDNYHEWSRQMENWTTEVLIITQEFRFYYKKWADIFMGISGLILALCTNRTGIMKNSTVIMPVHYAGPWTLIMASPEFCTKNFPGN